MRRSSLSPAEPRGRRVGVLVGLSVFVLSLSQFTAGQQPAKVSVLQIGTSGNLALDTEAGKEEAALDTLKGFIKDETGFANEIVKQKDWRELADKLGSKQVHLGVFQGAEFAWARDKFPKLTPLALAVNVHTYSTAHVVVRQDNKAADFNALAGQSVALARGGQGHVRLFVERQCEVRGKTPEKFFAKITTPETVEDAVDDVVDGVVQAAVVDRASLEAYKRRKPGRFNRLKEAARSQPLPPPLVAYHDGVLDEDTLRRFRDGLLNAKRKERGERLLTLFRLTGFEPVPKDFEQVLAATRKAYPSPGTAK